MVTGGEAIFLGEGGRNFAAGMSGGGAFFFNPHKTFYSRLSTGAMLDLVDNLRGFISKITLLITASCFVLSLLMS
jgi:glutamate synthase domain-containing protein 3